MSNLTGLITLYLGCNFLSGSLPSALGGMSSLQLLQLSENKLEALLLDTASELLPLVVSFVGRFGSETPINCQNNSLKCVILKEMVGQHFLKHNDAGWIPDSALMLPIRKEIPWYLEAGIDRVYVVGAHGARGLELTIASKVFEESIRSHARGTLDYLQGLKMLGVKQVEKVLPTSTTLTVVGHER
jgi:E3 ubiquitin-protein ligase MUL1